MAIAQAVANVFKMNLLKGNHDFDGGATYKIALYTSSATMGATTTHYVVTNEISNTSGSAYTAGGATLANPTVTGGSGVTPAYVDFDDASWTSASFTANGALIYRSDNNLSNTDAVCILAFGGDFTASNGTFTIQFPTAGGGSEIIRLG